MAELPKTIMICGEEAQLQDWTLGGYKSKNYSAGVELRAGEKCAYFSVSISARGGLGFYHGEGFCGLGCREGLADAIAAAEEALAKEVLKFVDLIGWAKRRIGG